ncbi:hypothetical protein V6N11_015714 [Hibiscus sabdariffa]|uniref:RNase H type-1 domain-containing protein n=1 Tax=Hibiscus sabdariffa TaxID=183260 RepID=A0ABR2TTP8_9ROSI
MRVLPRERWASFFSLLFLDWLHFNLFDMSFYAEDGEWGVRFSITCWLLWKRRCRLLFDPDEGVMDDILRRGGRLVEDCSRASRVVKGPQAGQIITASSKALGGSAPVCSILRMLGKDWSVVVKHIGRGSNGVADRLAQRGRGLSMDQVIFSEVPDAVACLMENEHLGSFSTIALSVIEEHEVPFDPSGPS